MKKMKLITMLFTLMAISIANAGVNLKNGNMYISYSDLVVPGAGKKLDITRTYNSKATEKGWFGFGWASFFETKLTASPDGCVVVYEHGAGSRTRFCPKTAVDAEAAAKKVVDVMRTKSSLTGKAADQLIARLKSDAQLRHAYAKQFGVESKVAAGTELFSNTRGIQKIVKTKTGYKRTDSDGKFEEFDENGNLIRVEDDSKYFIAFEYKAGKLYSLKDSFAKQIFFEWYPNGTVKHIWSAGDKKAFYKYEGQDLVYSKDVNGNEFGFEYDKNHNMTKVVYNPSRAKGEKEIAMEMKYEAKTSFVSEIKEKNGSVTKYQYGANPKAPEDHYWTTVTKNGFDGKPQANRYEYEIKTKADGERYTYKILTEVSGVKTETIYSECCSLPIKIQRGKNVTNFEYNEKGLLTKKVSTKGEFVEIKYHKELDKISKVVNNDGWTEFTYDNKGNLVKAWNNKGQKVALFYDLKGKITKMVDAKDGDKTPRVLNFKYNSLGKPFEIELEKVGLINVAYDNYGEIKKVESKEGHKMALQVTQAFQNLLAIVKPAGVNLNM